MALLFSSSLDFTLRLDLSIPPPRSCRGATSSINPSQCYSSIASRKGRLMLDGVRSQCAVAPQICDHEPVVIDRGSVSFAESVLEDELCAAVCLRVRTFYEFRTESLGVEDHKKSLAEREFEALKERISGKTNAFRRVACINATLPLSRSLAADADDLCSACKFLENGEERVVVGTLDLNQCLKLADELTGQKPEGLAADITRAYLSNVCVAEELQRNGLGYALVRKSKRVARSWGITDLYVHVAADNEAAKKLYEKSGFIYENEEPTWQARFLGRPRRFLLWADLTQTNKM